MRMIVWFNDSWPGLMLLVVDSSLLAHQFKSKYFSSFINQWINESWLRKNQSMNQWINESSLEKLSTIGCSVSTDVETESAFFFVVATSTTAADCMDVQWDIGLWCGSASCQITCASVRAMTMRCAMSRLGITNGMHHIWFCNLFHWILSLHEFKNTSFQNAQMLEHLDV